MLLPLMIVLMRLSQCQECGRGGKYWWHRDHESIFERLWSAVVIGAEEGGGRRLSEKDTRYDLCIASTLIRTRPVSSLYHL